MPSNNRYILYCKRILASAFIMAVGGLCLNGCAAFRRTETPGQYADMGAGTEAANIGVKGTLAVSSPEEEREATAVINMLFKALENNNGQEIRNMFSDYGLKNASGLDEDIKKLVGFYPGADGGYDAVGVSTEEYEHGKYLHVLDLILTVRNGGDVYKVGICLQMTNELDPSKEGIHLIEVLTSDEIKEGATWKGKDDAPGVYVLE